MSAICGSQEFIGFLSFLNIFEFYLPVDLHCRLFEFLNSLSCLYSTIVFLLIQSADYPKNSGFFLCSADGNAYAIFAILNLLGGLRDRLFICVKPGERPQSSLGRSLDGQVHEEEAPVARIPNVRNANRAGEAEPPPARSEEPCSKASGISAGFLPGCALRTSSGKFKEPHSAF